MLNVSHKLGAKWAPLHSTKLCWCLRRTRPEGDHSSALLNFLSSHAGTHVHSSARGHVQSGAESLVHLLSFLSSHIGTFAS